MNLTTNQSARQEWVAHTSLKHWSRDSNILPPKSAVGPDDTLKASPIV